MWMVVTIISTLLHDNPGPDVSSPVAAAHQVITITPTFTSHKNIWLTYMGAGMFILAWVFVRNQYEFRSVMENNLE